MFVSRCEKDGKYVDGNEEDQEMMVRMGMVLMAAAPIFGKPT